MGTVIKLSAKTNKGWTFKEWKNVTTGKTYSVNAAITIETDEALELAAVFEVEQPPNTDESQIRK